MDRDAAAVAEACAEISPLSEDGLPAEGSSLPYGPTPVLTVDELAVLLRVERKTAYAAIARGEIPGVRRVGRTIRIFRQAVLDWLASGQGRVSRSRRTR
jgi:excisionase family DNA binding protein